MCNTKFTVNRWTLAAPAQHPVHQATLLLFRRLKKVPSYAPAMRLPYSFTFSSYNNLWNAMHRKRVCRCSRSHRSTNKFIKNPKKAENRRLGLYNAHVRTCRMYLVIQSWYVFMNAAGQNVKPDKVGDICWTRRLVGMQFCPKRWTRWSEWWMGMWMQRFKGFGSEMQKRWHDYPIGHVGDLNKLVWLPVWRQCSAYYSAAKSTTGENFILRHR